MSPEITRETFEKGPGTQTSLFDIDPCVKNHDKMREKYGLDNCPTCNRSIETYNKKQKTLDDF